MRIGINFHITDRYISGVEYYGLGLIKALLRCDGENDYIVYTNQPLLVQEYVPSSANLRIVGVKGLNTRPARIVWEQTMLGRLASAAQLDLLHCLSYMCPVRRISVPCVVTIHDTIALDHPGWCKKTNALYFNLLLGLAAKRALGVIAVSKSTAQSLKRNFNLVRPKVRIVYPGIDSIFKPGGDPPGRTRQREVARRYKLPERYILYVGNIEPKKNIRAVLAVQKRIRKLSPAHKLVITGARSWSARAELHKIAAGAASGDIIRTGYVRRSDLPFVYQMADVFVFPSLYEGFGFPPLEAMACGTPVVTSCRGALAETVKDAALVVEPDNIDQITQAVVSLLREPSLRQKHIRQGLERSRRFTWEKAAKQTLSVYDEVCAAGRVLQTSRSIGKSILEFL